MKRLTCLVLVLSTMAGPAPALTLTPVPPCRCPPASASQDGFVPPTPCKCPSSDTRQCWIEPWYCKPPTIPQPVPRRVPLEAR